MSRSFIRTACLTVAAVLSAASLTAVSAMPASADVREPDQIQVSLEGVDFDNASQVKALYNRIRMAAKAVCKSDATNADVFRDADDQACERQAVTDAVRDINQPQLSFHDDRANGGSPRLAMNQSKGW